MVSRSPEGRHFGAGPRTIAVLPFLHIGDRGSRVSAIDVIEDHLIHLLTLYRQILVVPKISSFQIRSGMNVRQLGEELGAVALVEGSVRCSGEDSYQLIVSLIDTIHGYNMWSGCYSGGPEAIELLMRTVVGDLCSEFDEHTKRLELLFLLEPKRRKASL
jgi:TolB-like protein